MFDGLVRRRPERRWPQRLGAGLVLCGLAVLVACVAPRPSASQSLSGPAPAPAARLLLLGEVHDHPEGHRLRHDFLRQQIEQGWRPALVMEPFDLAQQGALTQAQAECPDADCVIRRVGTGRWEWRHYVPLIDLALRYRLPLVAGNLSRADALKVMQHGLAAALDADTLAAYGLPAALPADLLAGQRAAIEAGHCGQVPASRLEGMALAQVARDIEMAEALRRQARTGAVLIAGNGHVRRDLGVPRWLALRGLTAMEVHGYLEAEAGSGWDSPSRNASAAPAYDVLHRLPPHPRPDPCAAWVLPLRPVS